MLKGHGPVNEKTPKVHDLMDQAVRRHFGKLREDSITGASSGAAAAAALETTPSPRPPPSPPPSVHQLEPPWVHWPGGFAAALPPRCSEDSCDDIECAAGASGASQPPAGDSEHRRNAPRAARGKIERLEQQALRERTSDQRKTGDLVTEATHRRSLATRDDAHARACWKCKRSGDLLKLLINRKAVGDFMTVTGTQSVTSALGDDPLEDDHLKARYNGCACLPCREWRPEACLLERFFGKVVSETIVYKAGSKSAAKLKEMKEMRDKFVAQLGKGDVVVFGPCAADKRDTGEDFWLARLGGKVRACALAQHTCVN